MSGDQLTTYTIAGKQYAARSEAQALHAHRIALNPDASSRAIRDASRAAVRALIGCNVLVSDYGTENTP